MPDRSRKRPRDPNQLAKLIVDIATGEAEDTGRDLAAVVLGRKQKPWGSLGPLASN
jgi:hypothetical protein